MIVTLLTALLIGGWNPDPPPGVHKKMTRVPITYTLPAINVADGLPVPYLYFFCRQPVHGPRHCVLRHR